MKRFLMIILSFIFLGGAVTGSALLLSGCESTQTESGGGNSQDDILNDEENLGESDDDNNDDTESLSTSHNFSVVAQFRTSSSSGDYVTASTSLSSSYPQQAFRIGWFDPSQAVIWYNSPTMNSGAYGSGSTTHAYASYFSYSYSNMFNYDRYAIIKPYSYSGWTCVGMSTSSSFSNSSYTSSSSGTRYYNGSLYTSVPSTDTSVTGTVYVKFRQNYTLGYSFYQGTSQTGFSDIMMAGVGPTLSGATSSRPGYTQIGWSTTQNDTTPDYELGETVPDSFANGDKTLYAVYERDPYVLTINYYSRSATNSVSLNVSTSRGTLSSSSMSLNGSVKLTADGTSTHTVTISESSSYTYYIGTSSSATTTSYSYSWSPTSDKSINIYVVQRYSITYNGNGATSGSTSTTYKRHGTNATIASNGFSRTGHTFQGWATSSSGSVRYDPGDSYTTNANDTLYAKWEQTTFTYEVTYGNFYGTNSTSVIVELKKGDLNGTLIDSQTISRGQTATLHFDENDFSSDGRISSWFYKFSNSSYNYNTYHSGSTSMTWIGSGMLSAVDRDDGSFDVRQVYTITYNGNGATTGSTTATEKVHGISTTLASNGFSRPGYTFLGWGTSAGGSAIYDPGDTYTGNASRTLYAIWEQDYYYAYLYVNFVNNYGTYDVSLDVSGSGLTTKSISEGETVSFSYQTYGSASSITVTVRETSPSPNYFYVGTSSSPSSLTSYSFTWDRNSDKTVNIYTEQRYTITYDGNGSTSGSTSPTYYRYNSWPTIASNGFNRTGYTFAGWSTSSTGSSVDYRPGNSYTQNGYPTLYAVWTRITYTITYNSNGGSGTMSSTTKYYGTSVTLRANTFTRTGYHFVGWALSSTGSVVYDNQDTYTTNASDTLYAKWTANTYYVSFNSNGGSGSMTRQTFTYGTYQSIKSNTFTRTGYTFTGWNRNSAGTSTSYSNGQSVRNLTTTNGGTVTLYAQWEAKVQAKYDSAGGYWYVENGKIPQTRVTSSSLITNINNSTTWGQTYYFAGQSVRAKTYGGVEYCQWNGNWYKVEPIRWRLTKNSSQADGYATTTDTDAVLAKIVYVDQYSSTYLGSGAGYSAEAVTEFLKNGISTSYLVSYTRSTQTFGNGTTLYGSANVTANMFVSSQKEIESVSNSTAIEFSDLAKDIIKYYGGTNVYFTRDLGSNYNNITCFNGAGKDTQRLANEYRGVQFTLRFTEYVCVA